MTSMFASLRTLAGDALIAVGEKIRGEAENWPDAYYYQRAQAHRLSRADVREALVDLDDSELLGIAATVIAGWKPILLKTQGICTDVDLLIDALRDRADQFRVIERDADRPFLSQNLVYQRYTPQHRDGE